MDRILRRWITGIAFATVAAPALPITLGMVDTFQGASSEGWASGVINPTPPVVVADGGPDGAGDAFLRLNSSGGFGPGGKLVVFNGLQWAGNYTAAGVSSIAMHLNNLGSTDLSLRLFLESATPGVNSASLDPVALPAGGGWTRVRFAVDPLSLSGPDPGAVLAKVGMLRLYHGSAAAYPGEPISAQLGIDNVTAVPEPGRALLLGTGLALLLALVGPAGRRGRHPHAHRGGPTP
jgi:hypothetical protein